MQMDGQGSPGSLCRRRSREHVGQAPDRFACFSLGRALVLLLYMGSVHATKCESNVYFVENKVLHHASDRSSSRRTSRASFVVVARFAVLSLHHTGSACELCGGDEMGPDGPSVRSRAWAPLQLAVASV